MLARYFFVLAAALLAWTAAAAQSPDAATAIRHVIKSTWDKPGDDVDIGPIVVVADVAIAGWTQGDIGGRALLRNKAGAWVVVLCAGDQLKQADALHMAGISGEAARRLITALTNAEKNIAPERAAMFARFEGLVAMDNHVGQGGHAGHVGHAGHGDHRR